MYRSKPSRLRFLATFTMALAIPAPGTAEWITKNPPNGAVVGYAVDPNRPATLYSTNFDTLGAGRGVWKSTDSGDSWGSAAVNASNPFWGVGVQPGNSNVVVAGIQNTGVGGIERSSDGGITWASAGTNASAFWKFAFSVSSPSVVYAGASVMPLGEDGLMLVSTDSGDNWTALAIDGDTTPNVLSLAVDPTNADTAYAGVTPDGGLNDGLYKTTDGGASWIRLINLNVFTRIDTLAIDPNDPNIVYAGTSGVDEIWRSLDGGANWTMLLDASGAGVGADFRLRGIAVDPDDSRVIYAAGGSSTQVIASTDCGVSWSDVSSIGIVGSPGKVAIDTVNNYVYVLENIFNGNLYRETLGNTLPAAFGTCPGGDGTVLFADGFEN